MCCPFWFLNLWCKSCVHSDGKTFKKPRRPNEKEHLDAELKLDGMTSLQERAMEGSVMHWAVFVTMQGYFWPWTRRTLIESLKVRLFSEGWTAMVFWMRVRTSSIMSSYWLWRTSLSVFCKHLCSSLVWQSLSTMPECSLGSITSPCPCGF